MRYIACRSIDGRDLFGLPVVDGLEVLGLIEAPHFCAAASVAARIGDDVGVMPYGAGTVSQQRAANRIPLT